MPLGNPTNNRKDQSRKPTIYSPYGLSNTYSKVDPTRITFSFWNRMLKITIVPMISRGEDGIAVWDNDNSISAYLTHTKAKILANEIRNFLSNMEANNSSGIISNETLVTISNGKEFNSPGFFLVMRKINKEDGRTLSSYSYEFNTTFHSSVRNYNEKDASFTTEFDEYKALEVEQFLQLLDSYVESMTYAYAYANIDANDYNYKQIIQLLEGCANGLGVSTNGILDSGKKSSTSVFNQKGSFPMNSPVSNNSKHVTPEDIEDDLFG